MSAFTDLIYEIGETYKLIDQLQQIIRSSNDPGEVMEAKVQLYENKTFIIEQWDRLHNKEPKF